MFTAKIVDKYGSINAFLDSVEVIFTTALVGATATLCAITAATGGVGAVVMTCINYIIGLFTPGMIASTIAVFSSITGCLYSSANMSIRWLKGWGTNLYFNN